MSHTITVATAAADTAAKFVCGCGREFVAKTQARVGVTRSNAQRHAAACIADADTVSDAAPFGTTRVTMSAPDQRVEEAAALTAAFDGFEQVRAACTAAIEADEPLIPTPSGKVAKMVRVNLAWRHTTDGQWVVAKLGEGDEAWTLFRFDHRNGTGRFPTRVVAKFPTCTAALALTAEGTLAAAALV